VFAAKISITSTLAMVVNIRSSFSSIWGKARVRARAPGRRPMRRISTSPGILGFSNAMSLAASHICLWPP
jgi:hypothetical protein